MDVISLVSTIPTNLPANNKGITFFPNDSSNHAVITVYASGIYIIEFVSLYSVSLTFSYLRDASFEQTVISTSGNKSLTTVFDLG
jgi:hypothetical protein